MRTLGRLIRRLFKLGLLAGLGYVAYRLISERDPGTPKRPSPAAPGPPPGGNGTREPARSTPAPRPRAGTKPSGADRPGSRPSGPSGPPAAAPASKPATVRSIGVGEVPDAVRKWVEPNADGTCPPTHPVKANLASGIYHLPGGTFYERTKPDRCYRDAASAEADGLRASKS